MGAGGGLQTGIQLEVALSAQPGYNLHLENTKIGKRYSFSQALKSATNSVEWRRAVLLARWRHRGRMMWQRL